MKKEVEIRSSGLRMAFVALLSMLFAAVGGPATTAGAEPSTERFDRQMQPILESYLRIGDALSADSLGGVRKHAESIAKRTALLDPASVSGEHAANYKEVRARLEKAARELGGAQALDGAREAFKKLSQPMAMWATISKPNNVDVVYCSMAKASWVQEHGKIRNPYYGPKMLECGELVSGDSHADPKH